MAVDVIVDVGVVVGVLVAEVVIVEVAVVVVVVTVVTVVTVVLVVVVVMVVVVDVWVVDVRVVVVVVVAVVVEDVTVVRVVDGAQFTKSPRMWAFMSSSRLDATVGHSAAPTTKAGPTHSTSLVSSNNVDKASESAMATSLHGPPLTRRTLSTPASSAQMICPVGAFGQSARILFKIGT